MVDLILVSVTLMSLAIASVMGFITWRVLRRERQRTDARVAELATAAFQEEDEQRAPEPIVPGARRSAPVQAAPGSWPGNREGGVEAPAAAGSDPLWTDLVLDHMAGPEPAVSGTSTRDMFTEPEPITSDGRRFILAVGVGSAALLAAFAVVLAMNPRPAAYSRVSPAAAAVSAPLELLALDHARAGVQLSIRGRVRNPASGSPVHDLTAVVFLFDRAGGYLGTVQAPVAGSELRPGGESFFDVPVEPGQPVARYRVTFRVSTAPVPHVDRRSPASPPAPGTTRAAAARQAALTGAAAVSR